MKDVIDTSEFLGKEFIYKSKYGGEVKDIITQAFVVNNCLPIRIEILNEIAGLDKGNTNFKLAESKIMFNPEKRKERKLHRYCRPIVKVKSTKGVVYSLDEIYIKY